jgi:GLPGLI family protein
MKKQLLATCLLITTCIGVLGQQTSNPFSSNKEESEHLGTLKAEAVYALEFRMDSTDLGRVRKTRNVLSIGDGVSVFECIVLKETRDFVRSLDPNLPNSLQQFTEFTRGRNSIFNPLVVKHTKEQTITITDRILFDSYKYTEPIGFLNWKITGNEKTIMGYKVQEATTTYGCRDWVAWFTPEIPISDGPYKFHGLPGLIVYVSDTKNHYSFQLESIEFPDKKSLIEIPKDNPVQTTFHRFVKTRIERNTNPDAIIANLTSDPHTRAVATSNAARRNNFIELCAD